ncbi:hypothetical protein DdX_14079 [Ditylenchus destructor]|uniref:Uncharacterized protein n=1 Tax=Ditylenchus destructor TaxID=166010 RepID=A0AAD4MUZ0_9BILA|nr:hypothetical protein DdX_14079 [Ditylenchus destructor]
MFATAVIPFQGQMYDTVYANGKQKQTYDQRMKAPARSAANPGIKVEGYPPPKPHTSCWPGPLVKSKAEEGEKERRQTMSVGFTLPILDWQPITLSPADAAALTA